MSMVGKQQLIAELTHAFMCRKYSTWLEHSLVSIIYPVLGVLSVSMVDGDVIIRMIYLII